MRLTKPNIENYKLIIFKLAHSFHRSTGLDFDDLVAQGNLIFCQVQHKYKAKNKARFSTYFYRCLVNRLIKYSKKQVVHHKLCSHKPVEEHHYLKSKNTKHNFVVRKLDLSKEAKQVIEVLLNSPQEFFTLTELEKVVEVRRKLYQKFRCLGWQRSKVLQVFAEIKLFLSN